MKGGKKKRKGKRKKRNNALQGMRRELMVLMLAGLHAGLHVALPASSMALFHAPLRGGDITSGVLTRGEKVLVAGRLLHLRGGRDESLGTTEYGELQPEDLESDMCLVSNEDLESIDTDAPGVHKVSFTPAAQAYLEKTMRELLGETEHKVDDDVQVDDQPDEEFQMQEAHKFNDMLRAHPDRHSKSRGGGTISVDGPCADLDGSIWEYLRAADEQADDSANSSEFFEYLDNARAAFNRTDIPQESLNPADELDADMRRDPGDDFAFKQMFSTADDW